jgi:NTE family protein
MKRKLSLALGGGGIKGFAHIGILKRLEELGYTVEAIAGTSIGGLVGALYCAGYTPDEIADMVLHFDQKSIFSYHNEGPGLLSLNSITQLLVKKLGDIKFADLNIKFACTAVDIKSGREYVFHRERVIDAVLSTIAVPGAFPPRKLDGKEFVDGAVMDPVPVNLARWLSPNCPIIAVCLSSPPEDVESVPSMSIPISQSIATPIIEQFSKLRIAQAFSIFSQSIDLSSKLLAELRMKVDDPDVIIRPDVSKYGIFDLVDASDLIQKGIISINDSSQLISDSFSWPTYFKRLYKKGAPIRGLFNE